MRRTIGQGVYLRAAATAILAAFATLGCSKDEPVQNQGHSVSGEWTTLVEAPWTLDPGTESYTCARITLQEDIWVSAYRPIAPFGTHHTLITLDPSSDTSLPDEVFKCSAATNGQNMLFGSGVGTEAIEFPDGVGMKLTKGQRLYLNLHLFNVTDAQLSGTSGMQVLKVDPATIVNEAESVLVGKVMGLTVPPGDSTQTGSCTMTHDFTLFAVFPHMHQLGVHLKGTLLPAVGDPVLLHDGPYSFELQRYYGLSPEVSMKQGDQVQVECEYNNPGTETISFGDSSKAEMCFIGLFRYPRVDEGFICFDRGDGGTMSLDGPPCAATGAPGNENGVGKYCTKGGHECDGLAASVCLADVVSGTFGDFCTMLCSSDAVCGSGATCQGPSGQSACIPSSCTLSTTSVPEGGTL